MTTTTCHKKAAPLSHLQEPPSSSPSSRRLCCDPWSLPYHMLQFSWFHEQVLITPVPPPCLHVCLSPCAPSKTYPSSKSRVTSSVTPPSTSSLCVAVSPWALGKHGALPCSVLTTLYPKWRSTLWDGYPDRPNLRVYLLGHSKTKGLPSIISFSNRGDNVIIHWRHSVKLP